MKKLLDDSIQLLRRMIAVPSPSFSEEGVGNLISHSLDSWGVRHTVAKGNIIAVDNAYDPTRKTLALDAHMDTVAPNNGYTRDPYCSGDDPDIIWGLGSNDDGGSVVSMLAAFRHFKDKKLPFNLMLTITREEECSGPDGARWIYAPDGFLATEKGWALPDWAILGEPTGMRTATSERGLLVIDAEAHGVSGHAARNEGINALYIALEDIAKLRSFEFERKSPSMGKVNLNVTQIQAGSAHNVIPDLCRFVVDIRPTEQYSNTEILEMLQKECKSTLKARNLANRSSASLPDSPLVKTAMSLGIETFSSPTTSNWMRMHCDAIKMGPGESSRSHRPDEFIKVSEIEDAIEKYIRFIGNFHGNTLE